MKARWWREEVRKYVEESDCVILLGAFMSDINLGGFTARLDPGSASTQRQRNSVFGTIIFTMCSSAIQRFMSALGDKKFATKRAAPKVNQPKIAAWKPNTAAPVTMARLFQKINSVLDHNLVVVSDTGDSLFAAADLSISQHTEFLSTAYYTSMGFSIPASVGVQVANRNLRPLVLVATGHFK